MNDGSSVGTEEWPKSDLCSLRELIALERSEKKGATGTSCPWCFQIPPYQRMYVWGNLQVRQLLSDIHDAWRVAPERPYFLGGILAVERDPGNAAAAPALELIDGQQRLTTLWLLALSRHRRHEDKGQVNDAARLLWSFLEAPPDDSDQDGEAQPRLRFDIRDYANRWTRRQLNRVEAAGSFRAETEGGQESAEQTWALENLEHALEVMDEWSRDQEATLKRGDGGCSFDAFLMNRVRLLVNRVPPTMDLNHLFEVINDRSVQLEHHEVLKARLLNRLRGDDSAAPDQSEDTRQLLEGCSRLWDACAEMNDFIEANLRRVTGATGTALFNDIGSSLRESSETGSLGGVRLSPGNVLLSGECALGKCKNRPQDDEGRKVEALGLEAVIQEADDEGLRPSGEGSGPSPHAGDGLGSAIGHGVRSIVSFPVLLQHTLRLWLYRHGGESDVESIDDRKLLDRFDQHMLKALEQEEGPGDRLVLDFFTLLWEVRWLFDLHVIKWVRIGADESWTHAVRRLESRTEGRDSPFSVYRADEERGEDRCLSMLQSLLYHTQNPGQQMWLTAFLGYLHRRCFGLRGEEAELFGEVPHHPSASTDGGQLGELEHFLRRLDDGLNCVPSDGRTLANRTRDYLRDPHGEDVQPDVSPLQHLFGGIPQYWFYKIDWILWLETCRGLRSGGEIAERIRTAGGEPPETIQSAWEGFRITARTSVEHIQPQNADETESREWVGDEHAREMLHRLGNLALVSRSRNSAFGNRSVQQKRTQFLERVRAGDLVSPKLAWVYLYGGSPNDGDGSDGEFPGWTPAAAEHHEVEVLRAVDRYFGLGSERSDPRLACDDAR